MSRNAGWKARAGLTCCGMKELENVTADQKKIPQLRIDQSMHFGPMCSGSCRPLSLNALA